MIYTTGTVNTVSGSAIVKGTGTKFKNNNPAINIGMTILIKSGNTNIPYMIKSVNSDTELVLAQPALATATNTTFSIHITEPDNNSDAARTMVAINSYVEYFLDAMNTWMTQIGETKIEMPNGEIVTLDSIKKMQGDISGKLDKIGGVITGNLTTSANLTLANTGADKTVLKRNKNQASWLAFLSDSGVIRWRAGMSTEGDNDKFKIAGWSSGGGSYVNALDISYGGSIVLTESACVINGKPVMRSGDYGLGTFNGYIKDSEIANPHVTKFFSISGGSETLGWGYGIHIADPQYGCGIFYNPTLKAIKTFRTQNGMAIRDIETVLSTSNTTTDPQGFIKKASPIVNINSDGAFTTNDESEGSTVTRVAQGEYLIEGVLGFNSDAGWGGVDGGIEIPLDVNKQPLIWVNSKVNKDGSILVKTYHRTHPNAPKFARNDIDGFNDGDPIDIPDGRFISVRVQMPEQSIYNVRMREMEEAQKVEEERRQKEEEENQDTNSAPEIDN